MSENELPVALGVLRLVAGLNQDELARIAGLRAGTLSDYERGKMRPGLPTAQRLLEAMGYDGLGALDDALALTRRLRLRRRGGLAAGSPSSQEDEQAELDRLVEGAGEIVKGLLRHLLRGKARRATTGQVVT